MLTLAVLLGLLATMANPSVCVGFGSAATAIFIGFIAMAIGILLVAAVGYLLSPERVNKYYERTEGWLDHLKATLDSQGVARTKQGGSCHVPDRPPASEEQNLDD